MDHHPSSRINTREEAANAATSSSPSPNLPDNDLMPDSWLSYEDDLDTDAISNADLHSNASTLASSPPPVFPSSSHKKNGKAASRLHPTNPFSSAYKPTVALAPTPPPRPANPNCISPSPARALTPTPSPRSARSSELLNARIAAYEARTVEAAIRATTRATARATAIAAARPQSPSFDKNTRPPSASPLPKPIHNAATQRFPAPPSTLFKPDNSQEPHVTSHETLSTPSRTAEARTSSRNRGKGRRPSSVSSQLSSFADFYVAATEKFPELPNDAALDSDDSQQAHGSPGPSRGRHVVLNQWEEYAVEHAVNEYAIEDEEDEWEMEEGDVTPSPGLPLVSRFRTGGDDDMTAFTVGASSSVRGNSKSLSWEKDGRAKARLSCIPSAPSCLDLSDAQRDEEARLYWEDSLAELEGVADKVVLADDENNPSYSRVNSEFSRSAIPARDEHSEPFDLSERKPNRDEVFQLYLSGFPKYEVNNVFFDRTERLNEEAKRRVTCIDPNADPTPPTCPERKNSKLPLHERLSNMLPSSSNFTPSLVPGRFTFGTWDYRPRDWSLRAIEMASTAPDLELRDDSLRARAVQYSANRKTIEMALGEDEILKVDVLKCRLCRSVKASGSMSDGLQSSANAETLQSLILAQHELRQDIERLEARKRGIQASFSTLHMLPIRRRLGNALQRQSLADNVEPVRMERRTGTTEELAEALIDESCPLDHELYRALASLDPVAEYLPNTPSMSIATANLAAGESFPFADQARTRRPATRRSSSVYSDRSVRLKSGPTTPHAVLEEPESTDGGDVPNLPQPVAHDRAAAYRIMQSVQTYHNIGRASRASAGNGPVDSESARTGRTQERGIQEDVVVTSPSCHDGKWHLKRQNIV